MTMVLPLRPTWSGGLRTGFTRLRALFAVRDMGREALPPSSPTALAEDVELLRRHDPSAWQLLFVNEVDALYRYAYGRLGDPSEAEDVASQVFEEAWKFAERLEDRGTPVRAWLFGIARNLVNGRRKRWYRRPLPILRRYKQLSNPGSNPRPLRCRP